MIPSSSKLSGQATRRKEGRGSHKLRTLYRRSSSHNSFLMTERCNHYCLMCTATYLAVEDIDHSRTKTKSPQTTDVIDKSFF